MAQARKLADWQDGAKRAAAEREQAAAHHLRHMELQVGEMVEFITRTREFNEWLLVMGWKHNASDCDMAMAFLADRPN